MNTPAEMQDALALYKFITIGNVVVTVIVGVLQIVAFFRRQPPLDEVINKLSEKWAEKELEREKATTQRLADYQLRRDAEACNKRHEVWIGEVDRRSVHLIKDSEERTTKKFEEVRAELRAQGTTLISIGADVSRIAGRHDAQREG
jgi:hypothetical protein